MNARMFTNCCLLLAALTCTAECRAAALHVVKNVAEFDAAVQSVPLGDYIALANGEWRDVDLVVPRSGTREKTVNIRAETWGQVVLTGKSRLQLGGDHIDVAGLLWKDSTADDAVISFRTDSKTTARFSFVHNCAILGDEPGTERKWISLYGQANQVLSCRFEGKQSPGTLLVVWLDGEPNQHQIERNFFGPRSRLGKNGGEIIRIGDSKTSLQKSETYVRNNYFYHCDGEAEIISNKSCRNDYSYYTFVGCGGALTLRHGNECSVANNAFFGDGRKGTGGVRVIGSGHRINWNLFYELTGDDARAALSLMNGIPDSPLNGYFQVRKATINFNSFVRCKESIVLGLRDEDQKHQSLPPTECLFSENGVVTDAAQPFLIRTPPEKLKSEYNVYFGGELGLPSDAGWRRAATLPKFDLAAGQMIYPNADDDGFDVADFQLKTKPTDTGPRWLRPGAEFLPEVLKTKAK